MIKPIQYKSDEERSYCTSTLALAEEADKVDYREAAERVAEEVAGDATDITAI